MELNLGNLMAKRKLEKRKYPWGCRNCLGHDLGYSEDGWPICNKCGSQSVVEEGTEPVYLVPVGSFPDGIITSDLDWAGIHLFDYLGIAPTIGISGFSSPTHFKQWAVSALPRELGDLGGLEEWEAVTIDLYECWISNKCAQFPDLGEYRQVTSLVWRMEPEPKALKATMRTVFALRLIGFKSKYCA